MAHAKPVTVEPLLTVKEVAAILKTDVWRVRDLIHSGDIVAIDTSSGSRPTWRIRPTDLENFLTVRSSAA